MKHIDHHTLELHILNSDSIKRRRRGIARHLAVCPHCRAIADELLLIYAEADKQVQTTKDVPAITNGIVSGWNEHILASRDHDPRPLVKVNRSFVQRFVWFSRSHPFVASTGILTSIVCLVFGATNLLRLVTPTSNPAKVHYDTSEDILEVYDEKENLLWRKPSQGLMRIQEGERNMGSQFALVGDLDGNGRNEVITMLPIESANSQPINNSIRIFDSNGDVIASRTFGDKVSFEGRDYQSGQFWEGGLALVRTPNSARREILASALHYRSPSVIARVSGRGELLGEYWHFGHLHCTQTIHLGNGTEAGVIFVGSNDVDGSSGGKLPVIAVLDPSKIIGSSEATATRGFGYPGSMAEVVYIRIPMSDMDYALQAVVDIIRFMPGDGEHWSFIVAGNDTTNGSSFEYVFGSDWRIESVLSTDSNNRSRARLIKKGLVHGQIDLRYLNALKDSVKYWDGQNWTNEFSLVHAISTKN
jgi:hypothetical protein